MLDEIKSTVLITEEACNYLHISRSAYFKYLVAGKIKGIKAGRGWRVLKSELDRFLEETREMKSSEVKSPPQMPVQRTIQNLDSKMPKAILRLRVVKKTRVRNCLKCGESVVLKKGFFLCESCRKSNSLVEDLGSVYQSHLTEAVQTFRLGQMSRDF